MYFCASWRQEAACGLLLLYMWYLHLFLFWEFCEKCRAGNCLNHCRWSEWKRGFTQRKMKVTAVSRIANVYLQPLQSSRVKWSKYKTKTKKKDGGLSPWALQKNKVGPTGRQTGDVLYTALMPYNGITRNNACWPCPHKYFSLQHSIPTTLRYSTGLYNVES